MTLEEILATLNKFKDDLVRNQPRGKFEVIQRVVDKDDLIHHFKIKAKGQSLFQFFEMENFFKVIHKDNEEKYYYDYHKLVLFFLLYTEIPASNYGTKIQQLFLVMADEQHDIESNEIELISCTRGPVKHVIEILQGITCILTTQMINDSLQHSEMSEEEIEVFDLFKKSLDLQDEMK